MNASSLRADGGVLCWSATQQAFNRKVPCHFRFLLSRTWCEVEFVAECAALRSGSHREVKGTNRCCMHIEQAFRDNARCSFVRSASSESQSGYVDSSKSSGPDMPNMLLCKEGNRARSWRGCSDARSRTSWPAPHHARRVLSQSPHYSLSRATVLFGKSQASGRLQS